MATHQNSQPGSSSAILYQNSQKTIFLLDIPTSLALAQADGRVDPLQIYSCHPAESPDARPSTEPKTAKARARVLQTIPAAELEYRETISVIIDDALRELRANYSKEWCFQRRINPDLLHLRSLGKRKRSMRVEPALADDISQKMRNEELVLEGDSALTLESGLDTVHGLEYLIGRAVKNESSTSTKLHIVSAKLTIDTEEQKIDTKREAEKETWKFRIPPKAAFALTHISNPSEASTAPCLPFLPPAMIFDFILMDPPWLNRSVQRSAHYESILSFADLQLIMSGIFNSYLAPTSGIAAIWTTNNDKSRTAAREALNAARLQPFEEWIWIKTTTKGDPAQNLRGLWRVPYEVLVLGRRHLDAEKPEPVKRRVIAAVPDIHSRKPNLKELVEEIFFTAKDSSSAATVRGYDALEVFARNLTAGWWSCGNEVLRFNWDGWWDNTSHRQA